MVRRIYVRLHLIDAEALSHARNSSTFEAIPPSPGRSGPTQIFVAYFFLGQGHDSLKFADRHLKKNFGKKIFPLGVRLRIFF